MEKAESSFTRAGGSDLLQLSWYPMVKRDTNIKIKTLPSMDQSIPASKTGNPPPAPDKTLIQMGLRLLGRMDQAPVVLLLICEKYAKKEVSY